MIFKFEIISNNLNIEANSSLMQAQEKLLELSKKQISFQFTFNPFSKPMICSGQLYNQPLEEMDSNRIDLTMLQQTQNQEPDQ